MPLQASEKDLLLPHWPSPGEEIHPGRCQPHNRSGLLALLHRGKTRLGDVHNLKEATRPASPRSLLEKEGEGGQTGRKSGGLWGSSGLVMRPGLGGQTPGLWALSSPPCVALDKLLPLSGPRISQL